MIEKVPHPCKYSQYGCDVKKPLKEIIEHEAKCPERTIKCPGLLCKEKVKIGKYYEEHAMKKSECNRTPFIAQTKLERETRCNIEVDSIENYPLKDRVWKLKAYETQGKIFYMHPCYFASEKNFAFYITMAENSSEAGKYLAQITLKNQNDERKCLTNVQDVMSMDSAPSDKNEVLEAKGVMLVPWRTMSKFLMWTIKEDGKQAASIKPTIDIIV